MSWKQQACSQGRDLGTWPISRGVRQSGLGAWLLPFLYGARPDANYDPASGAPSNWELYRECGARTASSSSTATSSPSSILTGLATIHVPTLVMGRRPRRVRPSAVKGNARKIVGSQLVILPNSGHMNFVDQPDLWEKAVEGLPESITGVQTHNAPKSLRMSGRLILKYNLLRPAVFFSAASAAFALCTRSVNPAASLTAMSPGSCGQAQCRPS